MSETLKVYNCGVMYCGGESGCVHKLLTEKCPLCAMPLVLVTTNGVKFCSNHSEICDYEITPLEAAEGHRS